LEKNEFEKRKKLKTLYETTFYRDIVERFKIRNYETAKNVLEILLSNYSNKITISKLNRFLNSAGIKIAKKMPSPFFFCLRIPLQRGKGYCYQEKYIL